MKGKGSKTSPNKEKNKKASSGGTSEAILVENSHVKHGIDVFGFPNGDRYLGGYRATIDRTIHRQGEGLYYTSDDQWYKGQWDNDVLIGEVKIKYTDNSYYIGKMSEFKYNGEGIYEFPNGAKMTCLFDNNRPIGKVVLEDPSGHQWFGTAEADGVTLNPENHYLTEVKERLETIEQSRKESLKKMYSDISEQHSNEERISNESTRSLLKTKTPSKTSKTSSRSSKSKSTDSVVRTSNSGKNSPKKTARSASELTTTKTSSITNSKM